MKRRGEPKNKRAREVLEISQRALELHLSELAAWTTHEISQPLMIISANTQASIRLIDPASPHAAELRQSLEDVLAANQRAARILKHLRALLVELGTDTGPVDLNALIEQSIRVLQACSALKGVDVQVSPAPQLPPVPGNWNQLQHVFVSLILAAGDALRAAPPPARALRIETAHPTPAVVRASVRTGILDADMTTQDGARGIGVRLAHSIVAAHGGEMRADLHPEHGMSYHLELPVLHRRA